MLWPAEMPLSASIEPSMALTFPKVERMLPSKAKISPVCEVMSDHAKTPVGGLHGP